MAKVGRLLIAHKQKSGMGSFGRGISFCRQPYKTQKLITVDLTLTPFRIIRLDAVR